MMNWSKHNLSLAKQLSQDSAWVERRDGWSKEVRHKQKKTRIMGGSHPDWQSAMVGGQAMIYLNEWVG